MIIKCPKKCKTCKPIHLDRAGHSFICTGNNSKPTKYRHDTLKLCLYGKFVKDFSMEMTPAEALLISKALLNAIKI